MKMVLRDDASGVSEVVGTILILAMTVVLFSTIIVWVSSIPTPVAQTRLDVQGVLTPKFTGGVETGNWINLTHNGGESLQPLTTILYVVDQKGSSAATTSILRLHPYQNLAIPNGLIDGSDSVWNVGERWIYFNASMRVSDKITVTIVDTARSTVLWTSTLTPPAGTRPPVFTSVWANRYLGVPTVSTPVTGAPVYIFAQITDLDGDLNVNSVYASLTVLYGTANPCAIPQPMYDDGSNGDQVRFDGTFTLARTSCLNPDISWDGSIVLFNATDLKGHQTSTRMTLHVVPGPTGGTQGGGGGPGSGRPPNLRWNGNQGYNIFNATQWDQFGYQALETRTFKDSDTVVLVVGSLTLENTFGIDSFNLWDPFSGNPSQAVVYGATKTVSLASLPSSLQSFTFFQFVNGYYVYTYRFNLNHGVFTVGDPVNVGTNFYTAPPQYPRYYYDAKYPLSMLLTSSTGNKFSTTDSINITSVAGQLRSFPVLQTFSDAGFTTPSATFRSTDVVYVKVQMLTTDLNSTPSLNGVTLGNVIIQDFSGGQQLARAPLPPTSGQNGPQANLPLCPIWTPCSGQLLKSLGAPTSVYEFAIYLARVNQDPWVAGAQNYALSIASIRDTDETYGTVSAQVVITAPLYKMDVLAGVSENSNNAWGTKNYAMFFQNYNGFDAWKPQRVDYCTGTISTSGVSGSGATCPSTSSTMPGVRVAFGDFNVDGTLDAAESFLGSNSASPASTLVIYRRGLDANGDIVYLPVFIDPTGNTPCTAITTGDVTGDGAPEVVCGASNGWVWYYRNDGNWNRVVVDQPSGGKQITSIAVADFNGDGKNDIAVGGLGGYLKWYPNLDGLGRFQNSGISDNWFAASEQLVNGTLTNSYLQTYVKDGLYEQTREASVGVPLYTGSTVNGGFNTSAANWTSGQISGTGSQTYQSSGGNSGGYAQVVNNFVANTIVAGYWMQSFTVTGSQPFTSFLNLDWRVNAQGASSTTLYAFVDTTAAAPPQNVPANSWVWTSGAQTSAGGWTHVSNQPVTRVTVPGTYYLKIAVYSTYGSSGTATTGGFDNVQLTWTSTPGQTSGLELYWRMNTLPNRPGTAFTFAFTGRMTASTDGDVFNLYYATNVAGGDPTTGTYTLLATISSTSDTTISVPLTPATNFMGATVWIKALDTNRVVGNQTFDTLFVDQMYINANTPSGTTGATLTNPSDTSDVTAISAGNQDGDAYVDLAVSTANGHVFKYLGSVGGLTTPTAAFYTTPGSVPLVGVKWGNMSSAVSSPGLEIVIAFGTTIQVLTGSGSTGTVIAASLPSFSPSSTITVLAVGDVNGDGPDDVVIGTSGGLVFLFANLGNAASWSNVVTIFNNGGSPIFALRLGDSNNSLYMGR